jgi:YggT family protein
MGMVPYPVKRTPESASLSLSIVRVALSLRPRKANATVIPSPLEGPLMHALIDLIIKVIEIYMWCLGAYVILSWLLAFGVVNRYNNAVRTVEIFLSRITEPALRPIRRVLPDLGGIDISPVMLILILWFISDLLDKDIRHYLA